MCFFLGSLCLRQGRTDGMRLDLAPLGVSVSLIQPGFVASSMCRHAGLRPIPQRDDDARDRGRAARRVPAHALSRLRRARDPGGPRPLDGRGAARSAQGPHRAALPSPPEPRHVGRVIHGACLFDIEHGGYVLNAQTAPRHTRHPTHRDHVMLASPRASYRQFRVRRVARGRPTRHRAPSPLHHEYGGWVSMPLLSGRTFHADC